MTLEVNKDAAAKLLKDDATGATGCLFSVDALLGDAWHGWEPQSVWIELGRRSIDVSAGNRSQIMAARNLLTTGRFWYDANVFEKTCIAFNNEEIQTEALEAAPVAYIAWTTWEAEELAKAHPEIEAAEFDREPLCYTAVQLFREGFVVPADNLEWVEEELQKQYPKETKELASTVRKGWAAAPRTKNIRDAAFPETPAGVQLARLATVRHYLNERRVQYTKDLAALRA